MPSSPAMHVQIRLKPPKKPKSAKKPAPNALGAVELARNQPVPSYDEALMMPERAPDPPESTLTVATDGVNVRQAEEEDSYSADGEAFESYSVEGGEEEAEDDVEGQLKGSIGDSVDDGDDGESDGGAERESSEEERVDMPSIHQHAETDRCATAPAARKHAGVSYSYDENTYTVVMRLRAQNKRLVSQLEQQCRLIDSLTEEKKQQQRLIQTLRADVSMHKQTIHALQAASVRGARPSIGQRSQIDQERPSTTASALPHVPKAVDAANQPASPRSNVTRWVASPPSPAPSATTAQLRAASSSPLSPNGHRRNRTGSGRPSEEPASPSPPHSLRHENTLDKYVAKLERAEHERKEQAARHAHQLANYSHELSRLERQLEHAQRAAQEKENALRLQRIRQLYHSPTSSAGSGSSSIGSGGGGGHAAVAMSKRRDALHGKSSIFSDDIWRELLPVPPARTIASDSDSSPVAPAPGSDAAASGFSSHVGLAFEQLVAHPLMALHDASLDASAREWLFELRACGTQMLGLHAAFQALGRALKALAESCSTYQLADALTRESCALLQAEQALVFIADKAEQEFWCRVPRPGGVGGDPQVQMVTVRSKLLPFGTPSASPRAGKPSWTAPCGLASMVFHSKRPLLLTAGQMPKHPCFSPSANDSTDRLVDHPSASTLLVPVVHDGHVLAVVQVVGKTARVEALGLSIALEKHDSFSGEDQALLTLLSHFASGLLPKVTYFTEVESNKVNEETLIQLAPEIFTCLRFDELGKIVIENAKEILDADRCSLFVADAAERMLFNWQSDISGAGVEVLDASRKAAMSIPFGHGIVGLVAETWQPINIVDAYDDPRFNSTWDKKTNYRTKSMLTVPILSNAIKKQPVQRGGPGDAASSASSASTTGSEHRPPSQTPVSQQQHSEQTLLGVVQVINKSGGAPFRSKDEFLLQTITKLIALAIENSQLFQKNQALCWDVGRLIADGDLIEALVSLGASAEEIIGVESACIYVVDEASNELVTFHRKRRYRVALREDDYRASLLGEAVRSQQLLIVNDVASAPNFNAYVDSIGGIPARNVLFAPLLVDDPDAAAIGSCSPCTPQPPSTSASLSPVSGKKLVGLMHLVNTKGRKLQFDRHDLFLSIVHSQSCSVVASILEKHEMLREKAQVARLLDTSMSFFKEMSPVGVINAVYNSCTAIFSVDKAHLFLWEPDKRHMWTSKLAPSAAVMAGGGDPRRGSIGMEAGGQLRLESKQAPSFIPTLSAQTRRISVLTDQRLRASTTEGLLEKVLVHGMAVIVREWLEAPQEERHGDEDGGPGRGTDAPPSRAAGRHVLQATASDVRLGFTKHSVLACPVWDHYGLEVVGVLVLLFRKGHAVQHSEELANLPILSRQIAGALNVCGDLSLVSARCRQLQAMMELSRRKAEGAVSLTLSARGSLVSFSQAINVATAAFNVFALKAAVHGAQALNVGVHALPMDEEGNRWGFQLSGASLQAMLSEHCALWIGKHLGSSGSGAFDKLVTDLQGVYQRKEALRGVVDCSAAVNAADDEDAGASWSAWSLPKDVVVQVRQLLWAFTDAEWRVDTARATRQLFPGGGVSVTRLQLEQALSEHLQLDQMQWDLLHARFADPKSDLLDAAAMLAALRPRVRVFRAFCYELAPVQDPVTLAVIGVHVLLREA